MINHQFLISSNDTFTIDLLKDIIFIFNKFFKKNNIILIKYFNSEKLDDYIILLKYH
jgi:hypothetical protein